MLPKILRANGLPRPRPAGGAPAAGGAPCALPRAAGAAGAAPRAAACPEPGVGLKPSMTGGAQSGHGAVSHTPERSGLPSASRGAGALRSTLPSAVFGMLGVLGNDGHCANMVVVAAVKMRAIRARFTRAFSLN